MPGNQVRVGVGITGAKGASSELDQLRDKFTKMSQESAKGLAIGVGIAAAQKGMQLLTGVVDGSIDAYREQQVAAGRLSASLQANAKDFDRTGQSIENANKASMALGFTDTDTENAIATLVAATHSEADALKVLSVAQDLARYKNISLQDAATALTALEAGRARGLAQLGINVKDYATTQERLAAVEKVAGGQAATYAETDLGKLDIATAKVDLAQEKFGKGLSHLEADILPAVGDAVDSAATALDGIETALDNTASSTDRLKGAQDYLHNGIVQFFLPDAAAAGHVLDQVDTSQLAAQYSADKMADSEHMLGIAMRDGSKAADINAQALGATADKAVDLEQAYHEAQQAAGEMDGALKLLDKELYGGAIAAGDVAQAQNDLAAVLKQEPQKHSGREWTIWQGKVAAAKQALFDLQYQEKQQEGPKALYDWLLKQQSGLSKADIKAQEYMTTLRALALLSSSLPPVNFVQNYVDRNGGKIYPTGKGHAAGGPVSPNVAYPVGEEGPEMFVPQSAGTIVPLKKGGAAMPMGGGDIHIHINGVSVMTPGSAQELARQLEPIITRAQQRQGHLSGARAF